MNTDKNQNFENHIKLDPPVHFFVMPVLAATILTSLWSLITLPSVSTLWGLVVTAALVIMVFKVRLYSLKVQDRVIRLEERLRLGALLPDALKGRISELSVSQLVALRFASDAEIPELVEVALSQKLGSKDIKRRIKNWRADHHRV